MRVAIFGANGSTGREVVNFCRQAGYDVVAAVRRPETMTDVDEIEVRKIDMEDHGSLVSALAGADALVSCLGHGSLSASKKFTDLYSTSTRSYLKAMREAGVGRIIVLSSGGVVEDKAAPWFYTKLLRRYLINTYVDMARMETILEEAGDVEWTAVRLTYLRDGDSKHFLAKEGRVGKGNFQIHFADAGRFIADELTKREWINAHPVLGYPS
ncbi:MAG: NAD(P)H-binding protein [Pseudomonadota bacterium]